VLWRRRGQVPGTLYAPGVPWANAAQLVARRPCVPPRPKLPRPGPKWSVFALAPGPHFSLPPTCLHAPPSPTARADEPAHGCCPHTSAATRPHALIACFAPCPRAAGVSGWISAAGARRHGGDHVHELRRPFNIFIASRGLVPMHLSVASRLPFFDGMLDVVYSMAPCTCSVTES
jgi:hypothetical protein